MSFWGSAVQGVSCCICWMAARWLGYASRSCFDAFLKPNLAIRGGANIVILKQCVMCQVRCSYCCSLRTSRSTHLATQCLQRTGEAAHQ